jgi:O-methyltransferase
MLNRNAPPFPIARLNASCARAGLLPRSLKSHFIIHGLLRDKRTMVSRQRLYNLRRICLSALPHGAFVECGVAKGGCLALMTALSTSRKIWGFDSFEGMPPLGEKDKGDGQDWVGYRCSGIDGQDAVARTFNQYGVSMKNVTLVKGWFSETVPQQSGNIGPIAILRLDSDWYESTRLTLEKLYPLVSPGGIVIIDDYHTFSGCRLAVDEFRTNNRILNPLITTESDSEVFWTR